MNNSNQNNKALFCIVMDHLSVPNMIAAGLIFSIFNNDRNDSKPILRVPFTDLKELFINLLNNTIPDFNDIIFVGFNKSQSEVLIKNALKDIKLSKKDKEKLGNLDVKTLSDPFKKPETNEFLNPKNSIISQVHYSFDSNHSLDSTITTLNMFYDREANMEDLYKIFSEYSYAVNILFDKEIFNIDTINNEITLDTFIDIFVDIVKKGRNLLKQDNVIKNNKEIIITDFNTLLFPWVIRRYITLGFDIDNVINGFHYVVKGSLINKIKVKHV